MKTIIVIAFASMMIIACSKKGDDTGSGGIPGDIRLYFDLKKSDGTPFEEGEIQFFQAIEQDGHYYEESLEWLVLDKSIYEYFGEEVFFGPCGYYMVGWEPGDEPENGSQWVNKIYVYLKYMDTEVIDTIMLRDSTQYPEYSYYDLFLNGEEIEYSMSPSQLEWLISIIKDEF